MLETNDGWLCVGLKVTELKLDRSALTLRVRPGYTSEHSRSCRVALIAIEYVTSVPAERATTLLVHLAIHTISRTSTFHSFLSSRTTCVAVDHEPAKS